MLVKNQNELSNYFRKNLISDEIIIGMGAGSISQWMKSLQSSFAEGGPVAMTEDVNVMTQTPAGMTDVNMSETEVVDPTQAAPMQLTYDQLRARLPKEIGDEIVTLLANSYEALADFASIATQADVDNFNVKYGVELVLPQGA